MSGVKLYRKGEMTFEPYGDVIERSAISRLAGTEVSNTMGAGIVRLDGASISWTVLYDEFIVTLEGNFRLRVGDTVYDTGPGDVLWIPENTALHYEGDGATVFYVLYPVDWKERSGGSK
ncbi:AraC family ligand binding domain-containing protein [Croceicoccus bisphenolivorans]|uniref:AraC family ligand binding domain-containing protein n=1 Tax=Croceicoccus bisphenolivorans TaxID=1783232 RepID=UPI00082CAFD0|nr:AraC family ligand binding domain-containing protein [Croceicoccus bisphenolivorans]